MPRERCRRLSRRSLGADVTKQMTQGGEQQWAEIRDLNLRQLTSCELLIRALLA
jgi:hypothetical protein